jgi:hypothetical protein
MSPQAGGQVEVDLIWRATGNGSFDSESSNEGKAKKRRVNFCT